MTYGDEIHEYVANIKVIGVGGAGNNAVNRMFDEGLDGVEFWATNTDAQVLFNSKVQNRFTLGEDITKGLGAGANPEVGRKAAEASIDQIKSALRGADMVFIAAGMGGGTGTGAAPVIARICKEMNILTVGIVTRPFTFEGKVRNAHAVEGLQELRSNVDSLIVISNDQLLQMSGNIPLKDSFREADNVLCHSVKTITDLILKPSLINLDFADVRTIMANKGTALIGMGRGEGTNRAKEAASKAVSSPLLEASIKGAKNAIVNITGGETMTIIDAHDAVEIIRSAAGDNDINIIFGVAIDESLGDKMLVTVIATEFVGSDMHNIQHNALIQGADTDIIQHIVPENFKMPKKEPEIQSILSAVPETKQPNMDDDSLLPSFLRKRKKN